MLKHARWPEQFDCALCSSKGFATRAVRALIRLLQQSPEPITVFVLHDADGPGTVIYEVLQRALEACGVKVINLGLDPAEAREMGLTVEPVKRKMNKRVPVADYIPDYDKEWLQKNRCEINALTTPQLIERLTTKFTDHYLTMKISPKVIPPAKVVTARLEQETQAAIERRILDEVMKAANIPGRVQAEFAKVKRQVKVAAKALARDLPQRLSSTPVAHWTSVVITEAAGIVIPDGGGKPVKNAKSEA